METGNYVKNRTDKNIYTEINLKKIGKMKQKNHWHSERKCI